MGSINSHRDLIAWQKAFDFATAVYEATKSFPTDERFGLISQLRRGAVSVVSNIAEGYGRGSTADYVRFLRTSRGSLYEIDTQLLLALRLEFLSDGVHRALQNQLDESAKVLAGLIRSIEPQT
jgi:four helix bundle protein